MTHASLVLLMAPREGGNATMVFAIQMLAIFAIFYFLLIRPQKKEQERHQAVIAALKKGDEIVTAGGVRIIPDRNRGDWPAATVVSSFLDRPPADALDQTLEAMAARYGETTTNVVAMQLEYPRSDVVR